MSKRTSKKCAWDLACNERSIFLWRVSNSINVPSVGTYLGLHTVDATRLDCTTEAEWRFLSQEIFGPVGLS
jgi:hypothetical protein